ncbi:MAG: hypothetical protein KGZ96_05340 [Clostridia bacterium]|jgi:hypothetical protein|nr:hypothetical protein [Clostridia bacterium]
MPDHAINGAKLRQKKLIETAWKLNKFRWMMYEVKLDTEVGKILGAIIYLAEQEELLLDKYDLKKMNWLVNQLANLGYDLQLVLETIEKLGQRAPFSN